MDRRKLIAFGLGAIGIQGAAKPALARQCPKGEAGLEFRIYKDGTGKYRWHLIAANHKDIIADSGQGYVNLADCKRGIEIVKGSFAATVM